MSFGYYLSGKAKKTIKNLQIGIFSASIFLIFSPVILLILKFISAKFLTELSISFFVFLFASSIIGSFLVSGIPAMFLGFCSPLVFAMLNDEIKNPQISASRNFVWGGIGSLFGSLLPNLVLIPLVGTNISFIFLGFLLFLFWIFAFEKKVSIKVFVVFVVLTTFSLFLPKSFARNYVLKTFETSYQTIEIRKSSNGMKYVGVNLGLGYQSIFDPDSEFLNEFYFDNPIIFLNKNIAENTSETKVLILGSAGATISSYINKYYGEVLRNLKITNVDIDAKMHEIAKKDFGAENKNTNFVVNDARIFLDFTTEKYDFVVIDLYSNEFYIPSTALSEEFFKKVEKVLKPSGVVTFNLNAVSEDSEITKIVVGSMQKHFRNVYFAPDTENPKSINNFLLTASDEKINFSNLCKSVPNKDKNLEFECKKIARSARVAKKSNLVGKDDNVSGEKLTAKLIWEMV
ncbi:MAG: hypothetical protein Fur0024_4460 [Patescibacteria group bacterium]